MKTVPLAVLFGLFAGPAFAAPPPSDGNVSTASADIRIWNVKPTSAQRQGSTTSKEKGTLEVTRSNGTKSTHDATFRVESGTLFQDGEVCHNYGPKCYCGTTTFRLESGASKWKFGTPSNNTPVACPAGIKPTGDAEIRKSMTKDELEAKKKAILAERAAKRKNR
ncbi:MAG: hypothetical protein JNK60_09650 [Acidobacteria bacterium]|nr:hypothetical protein [Acidobacteriota bacterium]